MAVWLARQAAPLLRCYVPRRGDSHEPLSFGIRSRLNMTRETDSTILRGTVPTVSLYWQGLSSQKGFSTVLKASQAPP